LLALRFAGLDPQHRASSQQFAEQMITLARAELASLHLRAQPVNGFAGAGSGGLSKKETASARGATPYAMVQPSTSCRSRAPRAGA
jgi:hypothetical protein